MSQPQAEPDPPRPCPTPTAPATDEDRLAAMADQLRRIADALDQAVGILSEMLDAHRVQPDDTHDERR